MGLISGVQFQNISCYGLSPINKEGRISIYIFQNISCYGLSNVHGGSEDQEDNFKTSHVTVYQSSHKDRDGESNISKHLMLRFIVKAPTGQILLPA